MKFRYIHQIIVFSILISTINFSCKKFVEIDAPRTDLIKATVFTSDATAIAAILAIYSQMVRPSGASDGGKLSISFIAALSSDEILNYNSIDATTLNQFNTNEITATNNIIGRLWSEPYEYIYKANAIIEGLASSSGVSEEIKNQLEGEAKFIRAFSHFYLTNLFGDIPLVLTTNYKNNTTIPRTSKEDVYQQIISDLKDAQNLLADNYSFSNNERVRASKGAATALLARAYLYKEDWENAEIEATVVIENTSLYNLAALNDAFLKNSQEAIFQLGKTTDVATDVVTFNYPIFGSAAFTTSLANSFESGDLRKIVWVGNTVQGSNTFYYAQKYKNLNFPITEYTMVLRLAEQYLIRAEARAKQNKITGNHSAESDINIIRNRAGLLNTIASNQVDMLAAIEQERKVELFTEWGHRWLDLKRTGKANAVLGLIKGSSWQSTDVLYPIPEYQLLNNPSMTQNPGY